MNNRNYTDLKIFKQGNFSTDDMPFLKNKMDSTLYSLNNILDNFLKLEHDSNHLYISSSITWDNVNKSYQIWIKFNYLIELTSPWSREICEYYSDFIDMNRYETKTNIFNNYSRETLEQMIKYKKRIKTIDNLLDI